jgi:hypothetical protein
MACKICGQDGHYTKTHGKPKTDKKEHAKTIECLECGKSFTKLAKHLSGKTHRMTKEEYLVKHPGASFTDEGYAESIAQTVSKLWKDDDYKTNMSKAIKEGQQNSEKFQQMVKDVLVNQSTEMRSNNARKRNNNPVFKDAMSKRTTEQLKRQWQDDEWSKEQAKRIQQGHIDKIMSDPMYLKTLQETMSTRAKKAWAER